jgi:predicted secreted protein
MRQNAAPKGLARLVRGLARLLMPLLLAGPALAGDRALADFVGYSEDGRYFAFEEFGVHDGSGFAYSSIYVIDLTTDSWVVGTPVRAEAKDETATLAAIRAEAQGEAKPALEAMGIAVAADIAALVGDGVPDNDGTRLRFGSPSFVAPGSVSGDYELRLSSFPVEAVSPCENWFGEPPLGYELNIATAGGSTRLLHRDATLPRSRGCPLQYRLYGVVLPFEAGSIAQGIAIISVYPGGFEGPDRRFIAVPLGL